ncbi:MAG TPA: heavy-metal-associated domain-containing protein [Saliniramus sp.]|nr:heavy-metal-associated domain-containing protein [Saliniramus sp.]
MSEQRDYVFKVEGMSCGGCVSAVEKIVRRVDPEAKIKVDLAAARADVATQASPEAVSQALANAGYETTLRDG